MAVQRQTAASRSARPERREQHGVSDGFPMTIGRRLLSKLAHTPNLRMSFGQVALGEVEGVGEGVEGSIGVGGVEGSIGVGGVEAVGGDMQCPPGDVGGGQSFGVLVEDTRVKKRRLKVRRKAMFANALEAIFNVLACYSWKVL
uniref:Uncharacterized protein n=1 Tax=Lactuca sativa TaxID=4236 RepID=A0A9R1V3R1_LACSA|nr:hypothetical protein LSAT_V11C700366330 [Lactuca sativa]